MIKDLKCGYVFLLTSIALFISACDEVFTDPFFNADGKLTSAELDYFLAEMKEVTEFSQKVDSCIKTESVRRAEIAGDPQTIDPKSLPLPEENWVLLDKAGKRLILTQFIVSQSSVFCTTGREM